MRFPSRNFMKKTILLLTGVALFAGAAMAQNQYSPTAVGPTATPINGGTNGIPANTTNVYNFEIDLRLYNDFSMEWQFQTAGLTAVSNVVLNFDKSVTSNLWVPVFSWVLAANGTNVVGDVVEKTVGSTGHWRLHSAANTNAVAVTNFALFREPKPRRVN